MGFVIFLVITAAVIILLILICGGTDSRRAVLNSVGLDLSESAKESSEERDKKRLAKLHINSAAEFVEYHFPNQYKNELTKWDFIKRTINDEFTEFEYQHGITEQGWYFTGNREIQELCNKIIDEKIKKIKNS